MFLLAVRDAPIYVFLLEQGSLNAGVSSRKGRGGPNLGQQVHQLRQRPGVELLHVADERVPQVRISESFA